jgi:FkbM family methyltransferase
MEPRLKEFCSGHAGRRYFLAGAGASMGELPFTVYPNTVASTFTRSAEVAAELGLERRMVPVITVDHISHNVIRAVPDIIKVDAEGFEQEVVKGSRSLLGKTEVIFLEGHFLGQAADPTEFANLITFMAELDYVPYDFSWFGRRQFDHALELCEIVFVRRHGYLRSLLPGVKGIYVPAELDAAHPLRRVG